MGPSLPFALMGEVTPQRGMGSGAPRYFRIGCLALSLELRFVRTTQKPKNIGR
jgi:hypothetical protein